MEEEKRWRGVDLDGTLAYFDWKRWEREGYSYIGDPVPLMMDRVFLWLKQGIRIKIFTARITAHPDLSIPHIRKWLQKNGLPREMEITNTKDWLMDELWDDRCIQVELNTGRRIGDQLSSPFILLEAAAKGE